MILSDEERDFVDRIKMRILDKELDRLEKKFGPNLRPPPIRFVVHEIISAPVFNLKGIRQLTLSKPIEQEVEAPHDLGK